MVPFYTPVTDDKKGFYIGRFVQDLRNGEIDAFMQRFEAFFADFPYELNDKGYAVPLQTDSRHIVKVGVEFSAEARNVSRWLMEE